MENNMTKELKNNCPRTYSKSDILDNSIFKDWIRHDSRTESELKLDLDHLEMKMKKLQNSSKNFFIQIQAEIISEKNERETLTLCHEIKNASAFMLSFDILEWMKFWDEINHSVIQERLLNEIKKTDLLFEMINVLVTQSTISNKKWLLLLLFNQLYECCEFELKSEFEKINTKAINLIEYESEINKKLTNYKNSFSLLSNSCLTNDELEDLIFSYSPKLESINIVINLIFKSYLEYLSDCLEKKISTLDTDTKITELYSYVTVRTNINNFNFNRFCFLMFLLSKININGVFSEIMQDDSQRIYSLVLLQLKNKNFSFFPRMTNESLVVLHELKDGKVYYFDMLVECIGILFSLMKYPVLSAVNLFNEAVKLDKFDKLINNSNPGPFSSYTSNACYKENIQVIPIYISFLLFENQLFTNNEKRYLYKKLLQNCHQNNNRILFAILKKIANKMDDAVIFKLLNNSPDLIIIHHE
jgi:hypothetical protein